MNTMGAKPENLMKIPTRLALPLFWSWLLFLLASPAGAVPQ